MSFMNCKTAKIIVLFPSKSQRDVPFVNKSKLGKRLGFKVCISLWLWAVNKLHSKKKSSALSSFDPQSQFDYGIMFTLKKSVFKLLHLCLNLVKIILVFLSPTER